MTRSLKRTILTLAAGGAICAYAGVAGAQLRPNFPIRLQDVPTTAAEPVRDAPVATAEPAPVVEPRRQIAAVEARDLPPIASAPRMIQRESSPAPKRSTKRKAAEPAEAETYTVRKGDTLDKIADRMGVSVAELKKLNKLKSSAIRPGQKLKGPEPEQAEKPARAEKADRTNAKGKSTADDKPETYTVKRGDTLFSVAKRLGVSVDELREANGLSRKASIRAGQKLKTSAEAEAPATRSRRDEADEAPRNSRNRARTSAPAPEAADEAPAGGSRRAVAGRVIEVDGPARTYRVRKGDTLEEIADKLDTTVAALKKDNKLKRSTIQPGQSLKGPRTTAKAYVAESGDTLALIARRFGVSADAIRSANGLKRNATIRGGQRIRLPSGYRDRGAVTLSAPAPERPTPAVRRPAPVDDTPIPVTETPAPRSEPTPRAEPTPALPSRPQPYRPSASTPRPYTPPATTPRPYTPPSRSTGPVAAPTASPAVPDSQIAELGAGRFVWPLRGDVISDFGPKTQGQRNDGLNIRADAGTPVRAAAAGEVVYAGDQVPGFGNLVLIKHADGWVTAYGHLSRTEVKMQQKITQGQQIGQVGSTGGVSEPQLHFEVRYAPTVQDRARPVDPGLVLPR